MIRQLVYVRAWFTLLDLVQVWRRPAKAPNPGRRKRPTHSGPATAAKPNPAQPTPAQTAKPSPTSPARQPSQPPPTRPRPASQPASRPASKPVRAGFLNRQNLAVFTPAGVGTWGAPQVTSDTATTYKALLKQERYFSKTSFFAVNAGKTHNWHTHFLV